jgi:hypothetical protein
MGVTPSRSRRRDGGDGAKVSPSLALRAFMGVTPSRCRRRDGGDAKIFRARRERPARGHGQTWPRSQRFSPISQAAWQRGLGRWQGRILTVWTRLGLSGYIFAENAGKMRSLRGLTLFRDNFGSGPWRIHWWHPFKNE